VTIYYCFSFGSIIGITFLVKAIAPYNYYRGVGPRSSLSMYVLSLGPNPRMKGRLKRS